MSTLLSLTTASESLLASLALSPPHTEHQTHSFDADALSTDADEGGSNNEGNRRIHIGSDELQQQQQQAHPPHPLSTRQASVPTSNSYHAHVLHQIAVAATPRRTARKQPAPEDTSEGRASVGAIPSPRFDDDELDFDLTDDDLHIASLDSTRHGLPLAHLDPAHHVATPGDMLAQVAQEVHEGEIDEEDELDSVSTSALNSRRGSLTGEEERQQQQSQQQRQQRSEPQTVPAGAIASSLKGDTSASSSAASSHTTPSSLPTTLRVPPSLDTAVASPHLADLNSSSGSSPTYLMSPTSLEEFRAHMNATYDLQLSPMHSDANGSGSSDPSSSTARTTAEASARAVLLRQRIVEELLSSERSYLSSLDKLIEHFVLPLRANLTETPPPFPYVHVTAAQQSTLFGAIELIASFNRRLCDELAAAINGLPKELTPAEWYAQGGPAVGQLFLQYAPFLRMYTTYVANHEQAASLLQTLEKDKPFAAFLAKQAALSGASLQSHLIGPIQRVPRYSLLLQELLRKTPPTHPDFTALTRSLSLVNHAASHINESVRAAQNRTQILALQERFGQAVQLLSPGRWFVRQGLLTKRGRHSDVEYTFLLFNDLLIYASTTPLGNLKLHRSITLDASFHFASLPDEGEEEQEEHTVTNNTSNAAAASASATDLTVNPSAVPSVVPPGTSTTPSMATLTSPLSEVGMRLRSESASDAPGINVRSPSSTAISGTSHPALADTPSSHNLSTSSILTPASKPASCCNRFLIQSRERSFVVYAKSAQLKREWLTDLQAVTLQIKLQESQRTENVALALAAGEVDAHGHSRSQSRSLSVSLPPSAAAALLLASASNSADPSTEHVGARPPVLQQFKSSSVCAVCSKLCTSFSGRRHCQACGSICCSKCCRRELFLEWAKREVRVCEGCVERYKQQRIEQQQQQQQRARRYSTDAMGTSPPLASVSGPAPPIPTRPHHSHHVSAHAGPTRPTARPSKGKVSMMLSSFFKRDGDTDAAIPVASAEVGKRPPPADVNSDEEAEDAAGVLSPRKPLKP